MTFPANMHSPGSWWTTEDNHVHHTPELPASLVIYVPHASARGLDNRRPRARSSPRSQPRRRGPLDRGEAPELGPAVLVPSSTHRSAPSAVGGFELGANKLGRSDPGTAHGAHARCARPHRRTAPPYKGVRGGVRGRRSQPHAPGAPAGHHPVGEGWSANRGEPQQRCRTAPSLPACWPAVTLSNENALSRSTPASAGLRAAAGHSRARPGFLTRPPPLR
jgi:hypothetical protein